MPKQHIKKAAQALNAVRSFEHSLHRARAWLSPVGTVAPEGVLSLNAMQSTAEETRAFSHILAKKSMPPHDAVYNGLSDGCKGFLVNSMKAIFSFAFSGAPQSNQIKSRQRQRVKQVTFRPASLLQTRLINQLIMQSNRHMVFFNHARGGGAEWHNHTQSHLPAWFRRNHNDRPALNHFRRNKSAVIADQYLASIGRIMNSHTLRTVEIFSTNSNRICHA